MGSALDHLGRFARPAQQVLNVLAAGPRIPLAIQREVTRAASTWARGLLHDCRPSDTP
jgi:hypothetical protein